MGHSGLAQAQDDGSVTVVMDEYDGSGISGTATLTDSPDGIVVDITLGGDAAGAHPVHFHEGNCDTMDPLVPIYPLADIDENGESITTVPDVTLADVTHCPVRDQCPREPGGTAGDRLLRQRSCHW